jgi:hypothetical protein
MAPPQNCTPAITIGGRLGAGGHQLTGFGRASRVRLGALQARAAIRTHITESALILPVGTGLGDLLRSARHEIRIVSGNGGPPMSNTRPPSWLEKQTSERVVPR